MSLPTKKEHSVLSQDEFEVVSQTHYPAILDVGDKDISALRQKIRALREKERTFVRQIRRSIRGKSEQRGGSFPGNVEKPARRKQVFAGASKRLGKEVHRRQAIAAQDALRESAQRALTLKTEAKGKRKRPSGQTSNSGMTPIESRRRRWSVNRARVGSVSQAGKNAQAAKDARGA